MVPASWLICVNKGITYIKKYIDLVGPLSLSRGHRFLLTCVDRFTRLCETILLVDSHTEAVILAFLQNWIAQFGSPKTVTTDSRPQFESTLFA